MLYRATCSLNLVGLRDPPIPLTQQLTYAVPTAPNAAPTTEAAPASTLRSDGAPSTTDPRPQTTDTLSRQQSESSPSATDTESPAAFEAHSERSSTQQPEPTHPAEPVPSDESSARVDDPARSSGLASAAPPEKERPKPIATMIGQDPAQDDTPQSELGDHDTDSTAVVDPGQPQSDPIESDATQQQQPPTESTQQPRPAENMQETRSTEVLVGTTLSDSEAKPSPPSPSSQNVGGIIASIIGGGLPAEATTNALSVLQSAASSLESHGSTTESVDTGRQQPTTAIDKTTGSIPDPMTGGDGLDPIDIPSSAASSAESNSLPGESSLPKGTSPTREKPSLGASPSPGRSSSLEGGYPTTGTMPAEESSAASRDSSIPNAMTSDYPDSTPEPITLTRGGNTHTLQPLAGSSGLYSFARPEHSSSGSESSDSTLTALLETTAFVSDGQTYTIEPVDSTPGIYTIVDSWTATHGYPSRTRSASSPVTTAHSSTVRSRNSTETRSVSSTSTVDDDLPEIVTASSSSSSPEPSSTEPPPTEPSSSSPADGEESADEPSEGGAAVLRLGYSSWATLATAVLLVLPLMI